MESEKRNPFIPAAKRKVRLQLAHSGFLSVEETNKALRGLSGTLGTHCKTTNCFILLREDRKTTYFCGSEAVIYRLDFS